MCSHQGLWSVFSKKRGLNRKAGPPVHDELVLRDFTATKLNQLWLTDIGEHWTAGNPSRRGQAVFVRDQRPVVEPDHRLIDRFEDDGGARGRGGAQRGRSPRCRRNDPAYGPRIPISVPEIRRVTEGIRDCRIDGPRRRRQRRLGRLTPIEFEFEFEIINSQAAHAA